MNEIVNQVQPYIISIVVAIVGIIATVILSLLTQLKTRVNIWIDTKTSESQRELIHKIACEAFAYAESTFNSEGGRSKLNQAFMYASEKLGKLGIKITAEEINAAIEKAVLEYNAQKKKAS